MFERFLIFRFERFLIFLFLFILEALPSWHIHSLDIIVATYESDKGLVFYINNAPVTLIG